MTLSVTEVLDGLLGKFLRPLRTWIEREIVAPLRAAYDAAMQTKEQYRDGVYLHLKERLEGTDEKPLAEGVPVRPLPQVQDLEHLQEAVELLGERKIECASPDIPDGVSLVRVLGDSILGITELIDTNTAWTLNKNMFIKNLISILPSASVIHLGCDKVTEYLQDGNITREQTLYFDNCKEIPNGRMIGAGSNSSHDGCPNFEVHMGALEETDQTSNGYSSFYCGKLYLHAYKRGNLRIGGHASYSNIWTNYIYLGCKGEPTDTIQLWHYYDNSSVTDIEIRDGARQPIILGGRGDGGQFVGLTEENIVNHILNRLADNNDGEPITITLGSTNLAKLTDEEKQIAIDKNYILA